MSGSDRPVPRLLVSVRSVEEALAAIAGGCDLLDLKEPTRGSLGRLGPKATNEVCTLLAGLPQAPPVSVALGELDEWTNVPDRIEILPDVAYVKLGLSNCRPSWRSDWAAVRQKVVASSRGHVAWIAVHYADLTAGSPPLEEILNEASATGCRGLLIDTYEKRGSRLLDFMSPSRLIEVREQVAAAGLLFAVAGSLRWVDIPSLVEVSPDVIAVRGAVCRDGDRTTAISADAVRDFRREIARLFSSEVGSSASEAASTPIVAI